ncbi:hypothetical protein ACIP5Y_42440 [Nocardia sp. NPDC088792]|uniref:hypothetical protein n=1 Tax=Nocardia sp. NPDC088792 TaxID=3364332 RepID=UPI0038185768
MALADGSAAARYPERPSTSGAFRDATNAEWAAATGPRTPKRITKRRRAAATESMFADVADWLATHPDDCRSIQTLAEALAGEVADKLSEGLEEDARLSHRQLLAHHFWCAMLAAFAQTMGTIDKVPDAVADLLTEHKQSTPWKSVPDLAITAAVHLGWKAIKSLPVFDGYDHALFTVRVLAVAICPAPESHRAVFEHCVKPFVGDLIKPILQKSTVEKLEKTLPDGWI